MMFKFLYTSLKIHISQLQTSASQDGIQPADMIWWHFTTTSENMSYYRHDITFVHLVCVVMYISQMYLNTSRHLDGTYQQMNSPTT